MRRIGSVVAIGLIFLFEGISARAQSSLQVLKEELDQAKHEHQDAASQAFNNFITELDKAVQSPDAALNLYQEAGGDMPTPAAVITQYDTETPSEKQERDALDQANNTNLAYVAQLHCGLMRFAGYFIESPDQAGLHDAWIVWLKSAAQLYPQVGGAPVDTRVKPNAVTAEPDKTDVAPPKPVKKKPSPPDEATILKNTAVRDSVIAAYLTFNGWGDKEQGLWRVRDLPALYRTEILEPSRKAPSAATLAAWDTYITMKSADEPDRDKWNQVDYPGYQFDKCCDDYAISPSTDKLAVLVNLIKSNPTYPNLDDWISRVQQMMQDLTAAKAGAPPATNTASAPIPTPTPDPTPAPPPTVDPTQNPTPPATPPPAPPPSAPTPTPTPTPAP